MIKTGAKRNRNPEPCRTMITVPTRCRERRGRKAIDGRERGPESTERDRI